MSRLVWDNITERYYETGVDRGVVYPMKNGTYGTGAAWNGLITATVSPSGAEATALYANNKKYVNLISAEEVAGTIEAYTYPEEFGECNGEKKLADGVTITQQARIPFGFTFRNLIGNDSEGTKAGYIIHIIYGATASPSEDSNTTINDSPEAKTMSWEFNTTPVDVAGFEPTAHLKIDSRTVPAEKLSQLEELLYGSDDEEASLPLPSAIATLIGTVAAG